jgi:hypothetical protein
MMRVVRYVRVSGRMDDSVVPKAIVAAVVVAARIAVLPMHSWDNSSSSVPVLSHVM